VSSVRLQPTIRVSVADASGSIGHFGLWLRANTEAAAALGALAQLRALLPTDCTPVYGNVRYEVLDLTPDPGAGDRTRAGVFVFETSEPGQLAVLSVPGLRPDLVGPTAPHLVDTAHPAVSALIAALQSGLWVNPFGYSLGTCIAALVEILP
jgi:hypothetical protein